VVDRVYLLSHGFQTEYEAGFANGLADNGLSVFLVGADQSLKHRLRSNIRFLNLRGSQNSARTRTAKAYNLFKYFWSYACLGLKDREAIFHFNGLFTFRHGVGVILEAIFARLVFRQWWLSVHNLLPHDHETSLNKWMFNLIYKLPNILVVHTSVMAQQLEETYGVSKKRILVVEHGIDRFITPTQADKLVIAHRFDLPEFDRLILAFGSVAPYKGSLIFLEAIQGGGFGNRVLFLIVGRCTSSVLESAIKQKEVTLTGSVQFRWVNEYIEDEIVPALLGAADLMVLPYIKIDQSGVIFAAKSAGLPIIASDVGSFRKYVEESRDCLIASNNVGALRNALMNYCNRSSEKLSDRLCAVTNAKEKFAWEHTLKNYCAFARKIS
jgi:glycosyltransferase involved in cell wall biosynthesis